ncbi:MAG: hypothetical protein K8T25_02610 [Planctomycetia bacterium]|nr:hypothetical protein [Planctomycetia bacterium]
MTNRAQQQYNAAAALMKQGDGIFVSMANSGVMVLQTTGYDYGYPRTAWQRIFWRVPIAQIDFHRVDRSIPLLKELPYLRTVIVEYRAEPSGNPDNDHELARTAAQRAREAIPGVKIEVDTAPPQCGY